MPESIYSKFKSIRRDGSIVVPRDLFLSEFNQAVKDGRMDGYDDDEEYSNEEISFISWFPVSDDGSKCMARPR